MYAQGLCTMQSQPSIHSPSPRGRGLGFRQGCRDRTPKGFMQGRIQVVEQSRCRTHRQQTTTIAETQSPQSVLIGIENLLYFYKYRFFTNWANRLTLTGKPVCFLHSEQTCPFYSTPAMIYSRQYKKKATLSFVFSLFPYFPMTACCFTVGCHCFPKYIR